MSERPIIFSTQMVRSILASTKTQTRRIVKPQPSAGELVALGNGSWAQGDGDLSGEWRCPYGVPGDLLWCRESFGRHINIPEFRGWVADGWRVTTDHERVAPSIHMPRAWSRLTLRITDVRVQRLQDISHDDAKREGVTLIGIQQFNHITAYGDLWDSINGPGSWDRNDFVWCLSFETMKRNVDEVLRDGAR